MFIKKYQTPQKYRNFIAKLPFEYQLKAGSKRYIATRLHVNDEKGFGDGTNTANALFDVNDPRLMATFALILKYATGNNVEVLSVDEVMKGHDEKDGFLYSWTALYFTDIESIKCGW